VERRDGELVRWWLTSRDACAGLLQRTFDYLREGCFQRFEASTVYHQLVRWLVAALLLEPGGFLQQFQGKATETTKVWERPS